MQKPRGREVSQLGILAWTTNVLLTECCISFYWLYFILTAHFRFKAKDSKEEGASFLMFQIRPPLVCIQIWWAKSLNTGLSNRFRFSSQPSLLKYPGKLIQDFPALENEVSGTLLDVQSA